MKTEKTIEEKAKEYLESKVWLDGKAEGWVERIFISGYQLCQKEWEEKTRWIPVDEKLPEREDVQYDVKVYDGERRLAWFNNGGQRWSLFGYSDTITHWRKIIE